MSNIVDILGRDVSPATTNDDLIALFEELLARAKAGNIEAAAIAIVNIDQSIGTRWAGGNHCVPMAAAVGRLHFDFMNGWGGVQ